MLKELSAKLSKYSEQVEKSKGGDALSRHGLEADDTGGINRRLRELKAVELLYWLGSLTPENLSQNRLVLGEEAKKKGGMSIEEGVGRLKDTFGKDSAFGQDLSNIEDKLKGINEVTGQRRLAILLTDDPEMSLQVGAYPKGSGSCQNYAGSGDWNKALMSYVVDAHIKSGFLIDIGKLPEAVQDRIMEEGFGAASDSILRHDLLEASVGRAIFKLVTTPEKGRAIFIEPTYTSLNKSDLSLNNYYNAFAELVLGNPMGLRIMRGEGKHIVTVPKSQNPAGQYEDCDAGNANHAGMGIKEGAYTMPARYINRFSQVTDADRRMAESIMSSGQW